jgi:hypothetical protein
MEPLDDRELKTILEAWQAPDAPGRLREALFPRDPAPWWMRLWRAQLRIPVPVAVCLALLLLVIAGFWRQPVRPPEPVAEVTFRELQPVKELKVRIIRRHYE